MVAKKKLTSLLPSKTLVIVKMYSKPNATTSGSYRTKHSSITTKQPSKSLCVGRAWIREAKYNQVKSSLIHASC